MYKFLIVTCLVALAAAEFALPTGIDLSKYLDPGNLFCSAQNPTCSNQFMCCMSLAEFHRTWSEMFPLITGTKDLILKLASMIGFHIDIDAQLAQAGISSVAEAYGICRPPLLLFEPCDPTGRCSCLPGLSCKQFLLFPNQCHTALIPGK